MDSDGMRQAAGNMAGAAERMQHAASSLWESVDRLCINLASHDEADQQRVRMLNDVLTHDRQAREEQLTRFTDTVELFAVSVPLHAETFGPSGTALPLADAVERLLKRRGVLP